MPNHSVFSTFGENESSPVALLQTLTCKILCQLTLRLLVFQEGFQRSDKIHFSCWFTVFLRATWG